MQDVCKNPDELPLVSLQAQRLSSLTGIPASELEGHSVAALSQRLRWRVDPSFWLYRQVCGQVVQADPVTGADLPVPYATVDVYSKVCDYWGFFPKLWPWGWLYPIHCHSEHTQTVVTDGCGNFCFWVPEFEIEWIRRWRLERICFPSLFVKPSIGDLVAHLSAPVGVPNPNPPDPAVLLDRLRSGGDLATTIGPRASRVLTAAGDAAGFGDQIGGLAELLDAPAFTQPVAPPLPSPRELEAALHPEALAKIDRNRYHGPYLRCFDVFVPEWYPFHGVPDIGISVTQVISGSSQTIYDGAFDIAWGSNPIPPVTVHASPIAIASRTPCPPPEVDPADVGFQHVGLLPVSGVHASGGTFDSTTGFATRVNQPAPPGGGCSCDATDETVSPVCPATAPFHGELYLYGATDPSATYYRILAEYAPGSGLPTPASFVPIGPIVRSWTVPINSGDIQIQPADAASGWYTIPTNQTGWDGYTNMLMPWSGMADGVYRLTLEFADAGMNPITLVPAPAQLKLVVDGTAPTLGTFELRWQPTDAIGTVDPLAWQPVYPAPAGTCPIIHRAGQAVAVQLTASVSSPHLRKAWVSASGCGGVPPVAIPGNTPDFQWYQGDGGVTDTSYSFLGAFRLPANAAAGCYTFTLYADTRAFNSAGGGAGAPVANGWCIQEAGPLIEPSVSVAIVD